MSELKVTGVITKVLDKQSGTSKAGKEWVTQDFILDTNEEWNNLYCFALFGAEKIENFEKYNKVGQTVEVEFNVNCREYKDKYYTNLSAWKIHKSDASPVSNSEVAFENLQDTENLDKEHDDLPF